jgi:peptidoglycan hydrolase-like protein with peptidoglycan-binding domain
MAAHENPLCSFPVNDQCTDFVGQGQAGPHVEALQRQLADEAGVDIDVDGVFGPETEQAVRQVQASHGALVDGVAGRQTAHLLTG